MIKILLAGEGHGAISVYLGLCKKGIVPDLCTEDKELVSIAKHKNSKIHSKLKIEFLSNYELVLLAGYKLIVPKELINKVKFLNIHYSLLPKYRGLHSIVWSMLNGEQKVGYTVHEVDEYIDHGGIIYQEEITVGNKNSWDLMLEIDDMVRDRIGNIISKYISGEIKTYLQNHEEATFVGRRNLEDCKINWNWSADYTEKFLKALVFPYPRPYFIFLNTNFEILNAKVIHNYYHEINGHVVYRDDQSVWIKLKDGLIRIFDIMNDGNIFKARDIIKKVGYRLGDMQ